MADASDTMRYLVKNFDIAPAGTREEGQVAKGLSEVFHEHGLETANKSFTYSSLGAVPQAACALLAGLAGILSGVGGGAFPVVMLVVGAVACALYVLETLFGVKTVSRIGVKGSSQNVVARHPAASSVNGQKARPVVVIAHYDTPRADIFATPALSRVRPYLRGAVLVCMAVDVVCMLCQVIPFPQVVKNVAWALGIVASAVLVVWGVSVVLQRFVMPFTSGANDNKASIAALFGLLDRVRPLQGGPGFGPSDALYEAMEAESGALVDEAAVRDAADEGRAASSRRDGDEEPSPRVRSRRSAPREPEAVRYGAEVVRSLGILPASCVIEYEGDKPARDAHVHLASEANEAARAAAVEGATVVIPMPAASGEGAAAPAAADAPVAAAVEDEAEKDPEAVKDAAADAIMAGIVGANTLSGSQAPETFAPAPAGETSMMAPVAAQPVAPRPVQPFRVITSSDDYDVELHNASTQVPPDVAAQSAAVSTAFSIEDPQAPSSVVDDPMWGTSSFRPVAAGRRILGDIPDPAVAAVDPFSVSTIDGAGTYNPEDFSELDFETGTHQALTPNMLEHERRRALDGFSTDITESPKRARKNKKGRQGRISQQAARMQAEMQEESFNDWLGLDEGFDAKTSGREIGSWDNFNDDPAGPAPAGDDGRAPRWQGGAARARRTVRLNGNDGAEVRRAAMTLGDRDLIAHEIWFVLTGASEAGHAGVEDFLRVYRNDLRGAYFVNLECVGAGRQSLVLEEGVGRHVKADRRLVNLFGDASTAINRPLALTRMGWRDTEATPILRSGCRAVTVCGVENDGPANAYWTGDTPEKVDPAAIDDLVDVLVEVIKNA